MLEKRTFMWMVTSERMRLRIDKHSAKTILLNWSPIESVGFNVLFLKLRLLRAWTLD
jgi:hypothetical protein